MSDVNPFAGGPFGGGGPFEDLMKNLARLLTSSGPINWEIAKQFAQWSATGGVPEANPEPLTRVRLEELLRVAELQVATATGLEVSAHGMLTVRSVTKTEWAMRALDAWRPLLERLAARMASGTLPFDLSTGFASPDPFDPSVPPEPAADPMSQMMSNLPNVLGPLLFGMQAGLMAGGLAARALGQYDLPMPRPPADELLVVPAVIDTFTDEWSLSPDDVRMWVCLREVTNHAVFGQPHVRARLDELIGEYVDAFTPDPNALEDRLSGFDPTDMAAMQSAFADPAALLGDMQTDAQRALQVPLRALLSVVTGYVDHVVETVGRRLVGGYGPITEAVHRRRLDDDGGQKILGQLFGVALDEAAYQQGHDFVRGVLERAGDNGLRRLWSSAHDLPTPAEVAAPGLWLARIDLPG